MVDRVIPTDLVWQLEDELDYEGVLFRIGNEFGIHFTKADYPSVDGTLGNLILMVHVRISPQFG